jgi:hypothetical protein
VRVIRREFYDLGRSDLFRIVPIGDVHLLAAACDEDMLRETVKGIKADERCYWIGMGDYCEWINVRDPRFSFGSLADWVDTADLVDLGKAQQQRFLDIFSPIADRCLALVEGNHEISIKKYTERDVFANLVAGIKGAGGMESQDTLGLGVYGWLQMAFFRSGKRERGAVVNFNLHHGFVGGRLAGAKALNMQRWLWTHNADICLWGHSHNTGIQPEAVEEIDKAGNVRVTTRRGAFTGTYLRTVNEDGPATYSEEKGYFPLPTGGVMIELRPGHKHPQRRIRMIYEG